MFARKTPITLGVVERALEQDRRSGDDRRDSEPPPPPKGAGALMPLLMFLAALVVAASTWNFNKLETDYQVFKADEIKRHEADAIWRAGVQAQLEALGRAETEREKQTKYLKAVARKMGLKVED